MIDGKNEILHISDGRFSLDPGAAFGIVPRPVWSRYVEENPNGRIDNTANLLIIKSEKYVALFDSGLSDSFSEKMKEMFEIRPSKSFWSDLDGLLDGRKIDYFIESHLHFDHIGRAMEYINAGNTAKIVAQRDELYSWRKPDDLSRNSYPPVLRKRSAIMPVTGTVKFNSQISLVKTGGHTRGHQSLIYKGEKEIIYFGDIAPSSFHVRPTFITAIDHFPLETLEMKKKLIKKALKDDAIVVFNHDFRVPFAKLSGTVEKPIVEPYQFDS